MSLRTQASWRVLDGFGRAVHSAARWVQPREVAELASLLARARDERLPITFRGAGRSYGDASLGSGLAVDLRAMNRMLDWNPRDGVAEVEPGMTIEGLWRRTIEDGWWPAVVPGTMFPTIGGCVSMNIHGKNNFAVGPFGEQVRELDLLTTDGKIHRCAPGENGELFRAVAGGAGLLGVVTRVRLQLKKVAGGLLRVEPILARSFGEMVDLFEARLPAADYLVGWVNCFAREGRGVIHQANHVSAEDAASLHVERQILPPSILGIPRRHIWKLMRPLMNDLGLRLINAAKYHATRPGASYLQSHVAFAFLLDYVPDWRLAYGRAGFVQYQLFVPDETVRVVIPELLNICRRRGVVAYLGVFKRHRRDAFLLSHAVDGYSLALDFPARDRPRLRATARELTARVLDAGGTFYLAKDALLEASELRRAYGDRLTRFLDLKARLDPDGILTSDLARRLSLSAA